MSVPAENPRWPWTMLPARSVFFLAFQAVFAAAIALTGSSAAWSRAGAYWPVTIVGANLVCLALILRFVRAEGQSYWDLFRIQRQHIKGDLLALLGVLVVTAPVAFLPNLLLGGLLYGDAMLPLGMLISPLPAWAFYISLIFFPVTQGLVELSFYFVVIMPRLATQTGRPWVAYSLASLFLGVQHAFLPLVFEGRFFLWRGGMYIPFAFLYGLVLKWRPRLLPYLAVVHGLLDFAVAWMFPIG